MPNTRQPHRAIGPQADAPPRAAPPPGFRATPQPLDPELAEAITENAHLHLPFGNYVADDTPDLLRILEHCEPWLQDWWSCITHLAPQHFLLFARVDGHRAAAWRFADWISRYSRDVAANTPPPTFPQLERALTPKMRPREAAAYAALPLQGKLHVLQIAHRRGNAEAIKRIIEITHEEKNQRC